MCTETSSTEVFNPKSEVRVPRTFQFWYTDTWKIFEECMQDGVGIRLARVYGTICANNTYHCAVPVPNVLVANVFGNYITDILCHKIGTSLLSSASLFLHLSPLPSPTSFKIWKMDSTDVPHIRECCVLCLYYIWLYA